MTPLQRKIAEMCKKVPVTAPKTEHGAATPTGGRFALIRDQVKEATASTFQLPQMAAPTSMPKMPGINRGVGTTSSPSLPQVKDSPTSPKLAANFRDIQAQIRAQGIPRQQLASTYGVQGHAAPAPTLRKGPEQTFDWGSTPAGGDLELAPRPGQRVGPQVQALQQRALGR